MRNDGTVVRHEEQGASPEPRKQFTQPRLRFIEPKLSKHGELADVTKDFLGFFGSFSP
jgi:hypothetical protein